MKVKCLWCEREFDWDKTMYKFCDICIGNLEDVENIVRKIVGSYIDISSELEKMKERGRK